MAPKNKKSSAASERQKDVDETENPLQAVVLADSFEQRFSPFSMERPRVGVPHRFFDNGSILTVTVPSATRKYSTH
ncbi:translation initiation factor eIF-2B epsilon subunit, GEF [Elasticomyces elasticus]|nr:translation initiation factor eIF-2B epsilon subunit, GEF [Elasticomyces elasticus]